MYFQLCLKISLLAAAATFFYSQSTVCQIQQEEIFRTEIFTRKLNAKDSQQYDVNHLLVNALETRAEIVIAISSWEISCRGVSFRVAISSQMLNNIPTALIS
jgi:hypothetical protein